MNDKTFKIKPKVWPKEYTFEEFKRLNPNVNENTLINYYWKYLQEYAEDRSRHLIHFNDVKDNLSKELHLLNEKLKDTITDSPTQDQTVGPSGAGRKFRSPLEGTRHSIQFDHVDDYLSYIDPTGSPTGQQGITPGQGTLRPTEQITISAWVHAWNGNLLNGPINSTFDNIFSARDYNDGVEIVINYRRVYFNISADNGDGTKTELSTNSSYNFMLDETKAGYRAAHPGWIHIVGTFDGRYAKLYTQGLLSTAQNTSATGNTSHTADYGSDDCAGIMYARDTILATYGEASTNGGVHIGSAGRYIGSDPYTLYQPKFLFSGSIGEVAVWDKALDPDTILEIYSSSMSPNAPNFDLSYPGYGGHADHPYDLSDEGLSYKNVGQYASSLQGWWRMNEGLGTTAYDNSGKGRHMNISNSPTWDGTLGTSGSYFYPGIEL
jgi:hypothetical protein